MQYNILLFILIHQELINDQHYPYQIKYPQFKN